MRTIGEKWRQIQRGVVAFLYLRLFRYSAAAGADINNREHSDNPHAAGKSCTYILFFHPEPYITGRLTCSQLIHSFLFHAMLNIFFLLQTMHVAQDSL